MAYWNWWQLLSQFVPSEAVLWILNWLVENVLRIEYISRTNPLRKQQKTKNTYWSPLSTRGCSPRSYWGAFVTIPSPSVRTHWRRSITKIELPRSKAPRVCFISRNEVGRRSLRARHSSTPFDCVHSDTIEAFKKIRKVWATPQSHNFLSQPDQDCALRMQALAWRWAELRSDCAHSSLEEDK